MQRPPDDFSPPRVTLVGAGDPELLTVKAIKTIRQATVLLVDDLVGEGVLRCARRSARVIRSASVAAAGAGHRSSSTA